MEFSTWVNEFVGTTYFAVLMIVGLIGLGVLLRLTFSKHNDDIYRHRPDE